MESVADALAGYGATLIVERWPEIIGVLAVLALWRLFTWHKVRKRIAALEARAEASEAKATEPTIIQNFLGTIGQVERLNGDYRVSINGKGEVISPTPIKTLAVSASAGEPTVRFDLAPSPQSPAEAFSKAEARWLHQPGAGREAARLIMMAPTFQEAEAVHDTFRAAEPRLDTSWAHHAFLYRMEMDGHSDEVMHHAKAIGDESGDEFIVDNDDDDWKELVSLYISTRG